MKKKKMIRILIVSCVIIAAFAGVTCIQVMNKKKKRSFAEGT